MQNKAQIIIEGEEDKAFLIAFLQVRFPTAWEANAIDIIPSHSKSKIPKIEQKLEQATDNDIPNLVIFDADDSAEARRRELEQQRRELGVEFEIFLFPDDQNKGQFEDLLRQIARYPAFFDCWDTFDACTKQLPDIKSPLYSKTATQCYCELYLPPVYLRKIEKKTIDYRAVDAWDLNHPALEPLYNFLAQYLT